MKRERQEHVRSTESPPRFQWRTEAMVVALIGAIATILSTLLSGAFSLFQSSPVLSAISARPTATSAFIVPTQTPLSTPTPAPTLTPVPVSGFVFATQIMANGQAIDPGTTFPANVKDLYAVFRPDVVPPGLKVNADNPASGAHYAYLKVKEGSTISSFGWRWYFKGEVINEYQTEVGPGSEIWLQRFDYSEEGIFHDQLGPGTYTIVVLLGGNPALSSELTIKP